MKQIFKSILKAAAALFLAYLAYFNVAIFVHEKSAVAPENTTADLSRLRKSVREEQAAEAMQQIYPEGFVFLNAMYGLAWGQVAARPNLPAALADESRAEMDFALAAIESDAGREIFNSDLPLKFGAFYNGWLNFVRGKRLELDQQNPANFELEKRFRADCEAIATAWSSGGGQSFLESYGGMIWPADNIVCLASLALHDRLYSPKFQSVRKIWLEKICQNLDPKTGLIPHSFFGQASGARGSSQVLMLCFLPEIDSAFARSQFEIFQKNFLDSRLGLPIVREFPKGTAGAGDVDSGPVIFGIGGAASIVGIGAFHIFGKREIAVPLRHAIEAFLFKKMDTFCSGSCRWRMLF